MLSQENQGIHVLIQRKLIYIKPKLCQANLFLFLVLMKHRINKLVY
jgi:hypothetical protein